MYLFIDIETTGLSPITDRILEVSAIKVTNTFDIVSQKHWIISHPHPLSLDSPTNIDKFVLDMHTKNGLWGECNTSALSISGEAFGDELHSYLSDGEPEKGWTIAGCSVHCDKKFLIANYGWFDDMCHYRLFDIRSLMLCCDLRIVKPFEDNHRAVPDNLNSIYTAKCYQRALKEWKAQ